MTDRTSPALDRITPSSQCTDMAQVRKGVDAIDEALIALLIRRFGYMRAAARIKQDREAVRDEARKQEVIDNVRALAGEAGIPEQAMADLWDRLVEISIAYEDDEWERLRR